jgi:hypothetical protein
MRVAPFIMFCEHHWARLTDRHRDSITTTFQPDVRHQPPTYRLAASRAILHLSELSGR